MADIECGRTWNVACKSASLAIYQDVGMLGWHCTYPVSSWLERRDVWLGVALLPSAMLCCASRERAKCVMSLK